MHVRGFSSHRITSVIHFLSSVICMVSPTWCHGPNWGNPVWGECWRTGLLNWHFNLVIRLSSVKQSAIPFSTFYNVSPLLLSLRHIGTFIFALLKPIRTARNLFFCWCSSFWCNMQHDRWSRQVHAFQVWWFFSFDGFLVRLSISCV